MGMIFKVRDGSEIVFIETEDDKTVVSFVCDSVDNNAYLWKLSEIEDTSSWTRVDMVYSLSEFIGTCYTIVDKRTDWYTDSDYDRMYREAEDKQYEEDMERLREQENERAYDEYCCACRESGYEPLH